MLGIHKIIIKIQVNFCRAMFNTLASSNGSTVTYTSLIICCMSRYFNLRHPLLFLHFTPLLIIILTILGASADVPTASALFSAYVSTNLAFLSPFSRFHSFLTVPIHSLHQFHSDSFKTFHIHFTFC